MLVEHTMVVGVSLLNRLPLVVMGGGHMWAVSWGLWLQRPLSQASKRRLLKECSTLCTARVLVLLTCSAFNCPLSCSFLSAGLFFSEICSRACKLLESASQEGGSQTKLPSSCACTTLCALYHMNMCMCGKEARSWWQQRRSCCNYVHFLPIRPCCHPTMVHVLENCFGF